MTRVVFWLAVALVALNAADLAVTRYALDTGLAHEANPLMAAFILSPLALLVKVGMPAVVGWRSVQHPTWWSTGAGRRIPGPALALSVWCVVFVGVVLWNVHLLAVRA